jgi:site-specific DNA-methyltransferase (adenine-specific)
MTIENNKLYLGDCLDVMKFIPDKSIDLILADLPYGTTACKWDIIIPFDKLWQQYNRIIKRNGAIVLFGQEPFSSFLRLSNIDDYKYDWYWQKERPTNVMQVKRRAGKVIETISVFYKNQCVYNPQKTVHTGKLRSNKIKDGLLGNLIDNNKNIPKEYKDNGMRYPIQLLPFKRDILTSNLHPTQKPLALCEYLVKTYTNENGIILDNTTGSGTVCLAAKNLNRQFIGIEKEEKYFNIAKERLNLC